MGKQASLKDCKLVDFKLLECSTKLLNEDSKNKKITLSMNHGVDFSLSPKDQGSDFCLNFNSEMKATDEDNNEYFLFAAKFRADFNIFDKGKNPPNEFKKFADPLGHQLFPLIRSFFVDIFAKMGIPPVIPWSVQNPPVKGKKKKIIPGAIKDE